MRKHISTTREAHYDSTFRPTKAKQCHPARPCAAPSPSLSLPSLSLHSFPFPPLSPPSPLSLFSSSLPPFPSHPLSPPSVFCGWKLEEGNFGIRPESPGYTRSSHIRPKPQSNSSLVGGNARTLRGACFCRLRDQGASNLLEPLPSRTQA